MLSKPTRGSLAVTQCARICVQGCAAAFGRDEGEDALQITIAIAESYPLWLAPQPMSCDPKAFIRAQEHDLVG